MELYSEGKKLLKQELNNKKINNKKEKENNGAN